MVTRKEISADIPMPVTFLKDMGRMVTVWRGNELLHTSVREGGAGFTEETDTKTLDGTRYVTTTCPGGTFSSQEIWNYVVQVLGVGGRGDVLDGLDENDAEQIVRNIRGDDASQGSLSGKCQAAIDAMDTIDPEIRGKCMSVAMWNHMNNVIRNTIIPGLDEESIKNGTKVGDSESCLTKPDELEMYLGGMNERLNSLEKSFPATSCFREAGNVLPGIVNNMNESYLSRDPESFSGTSIVRFMIRLQNSPKNLFTRKPMSVIGISSVLEPRSKMLIIEGNRDGTMDIEGFDIEGIGDFSNFQKFCDERGIVKIPGKILMSLVPKKVARKLTKNVGEIGKNRDAQGTTPELQAKIPETPARIPEIREKTNFEREKNIDEPIR